MGRLEDSGQALFAEEEQLSCFTERDDAGSFKRFAESLASEVNVTLTPDVSITYSFLDMYIIKI